jgi:hypothetical protein
LGGKRCRFIWRMGGTKGFERGLGRRKEEWWIIRIVSLEKK